MKEHFSKKLVKTKEDNQNYERSTKCCICDNTFVKGDDKVMDHCQITGKYRGTAHKYCNVKVSLNYKISIVFHMAKQLKN